MQYKKLTVVKMINNNPTIKIYSRLKSKSPVQNTLYEKWHEGNRDLITFYGSTDKQVRTKVFTFHKIFTELSHQEELFEYIGRPIVNRVLEGYNCTIFAYGQTGSGKTYTITGSSEFFEERGIIPRSIEEIFRGTRNDPYKYKIYISYIEIYNDVGYDLLNSKRQFQNSKNIAELHGEEESKTKIKFYNIKPVRVSSEEEAMMLLLIGDSNRITVETSRNMNSSRSHCIFTINIESRTTGHILKSKLNLIDLAGSERIYKSKISGLTLKEAKCINLSLHYLQDVVRTLCERKSYVPFRNSMLTYFLRDALGGSCETILIATLDLDKKNFEETIATCKFSQNVGQVFVHTRINNKSTHTEQINYLRSIIEDLQNELARISTFKRNGKLSKEEEEKCEHLVKEYLSNSNDEVEVTDLDMRSIRYCFKYFKDIIKDCKSCKMVSQKQDKLRVLPTEQVEDIPKLKPKSQFLDQMSDKRNDQVGSKTADFASALPLKNNVRRNTSNSIDKVLIQAQHVTSVVEQCQKKILERKQLLHCNPKNASKIIEEILAEQNIYKASLAQLEELKCKAESLDTPTTNILHHETKQKIQNPGFGNSFNINDENKENYIFDDFIETFYDAETQLSNNNANIKLSVAAKQDHNVLREKNLFSSSEENSINLDALNSENNYDRNLSKTQLCILLENDTSAVSEVSEFAHSSIQEMDIQQTPERDIDVEIQNTAVKASLMRSDDSVAFREFISKVAFTGDEEVDQEIINFYRTKFLFTSAI